MFSSALFLLLRQRKWGEWGSLIGRVARVTADTLNELHNVLVLLISDFVDE